MNSSALNQVRVWDLPTRLFHWTLVACVVGLVISSQIGGAAMVWHFRLGYSVLALLLFRAAWGLVGGHWSRFRAFIYSPSTVWRHLQGQGRVEHSVGHTPPGSLSVFALLGFLLAQVATGLMSDDEIANAGPLTQFVSNATVDLATWYHKEVGKLILIVLVILHVGAIVFYLVRKRQNLVRAMIRGDKDIPADVPHSRDDARTRVFAALLMLACAALVFWLLKLVS
jgi:cytochrome b